MAVQELIMDITGKDSTKYTFIGAFVCTRSCSNIIQAIKKAFKHYWINTVNINNIKWLDELYALYVGQNFRHIFWHTISKASIILNYSFSLFIVRNIYDYVIWIYTYE